MDSRILQNNRSDEMKTNDQLLTEAEDETREEIERVFKERLKDCIKDRKASEETLDYQILRLEQLMITSPEEIYKKYAYMYGEKNKGIISH